MSTAVLDYFVLEGSECVERLDGLLARAASGFSMNSAATCGVALPTANAGSNSPARM